MASLSEVTLLKDPEVLRAVAEHITLPPHLPQEAHNPERLGAVESAICALAAASARAYAGQVTNAKREGWNRLAQTMESLASWVTHGPLEPSVVQRKLENMAERDVLVLHIRAQNAAVVIRRENFDTTFEHFEVQVPNSEVMASSGKLVRVFPASAVRISNFITNEPGFYEQIAVVLASLDQEEFSDAVAYTKKANSFHQEAREPNNPKYISEFLMGILRGYGEPAKVQTVTKRIADDILWKSAFAPWRRSPAWLIIRVVLQTTLANRAPYKEFMIFLHNTLLRHCIQRDLDSELLYIIRTKVVRRLHKLQDVFPPPFLKSLSLEVAEETEGVLQTRWSAIQEQERRKSTVSWEPEKLDLEGDTLQSLPHCGSYLRRVFRQELRPAAANHFQPSSIIRLMSTNFDDYANRGLDDSMKRDSDLALLDFEFAVRSHLDAWLSGRDGSAEQRRQACETLVSCIEQYEKAAKSRYTVDIAERSISVLTILELWVALDRLAITDVPLLGEYSPEIPSNFLKDLLLRTRSDIERVNSVERYLRQRHADMLHGSVFSNQADDSSFGIRYYNSSVHMQALKTKIEIAAQKSRNQKIQELNRLNAEYELLRAQADARVCDEQWNSYHQRYQHAKKTCVKCRLAREATSIGNTGILADEWPLPERDDLAKRVIFELAVPTSVQLWRSVTYMILWDIGSSQYKARQQQPEHQLQAYEGLSSYGRFHTSNRVSIASTTKSFMRSHYKKPKIPATEEAVCTPNGLSYQLYDDHSQQWIANTLQSTSTSIYGTFLLPTASSYKYLQYAVNTTEHTSNQVIADRYDCPRDMSLSEHDSFGGLRSGAHLQWLNILRELEDSALTFRQEEVHILITQAAWQLGVLSDNGRVRLWHQDLGRKEYGLALLNACSRVLANVKANWMEAITVKTLVALTLRLLSHQDTTQDPHVRQVAFAVLQDARVVVFAWLQVARELTKTNTRDDISAIYSQLVCELAMICRMTYDVDREDLPLVLAATEDVAMCLQCAIALQDNRPPEPRLVPAHLQILLRRDRRLAHKLQGNLRLRLERDWTGFHTTVKQAWALYEATETARSLQHGQWLCATTILRMHSEMQQVHYDLLEGTLLINGKSLGRLPRSYVAHPTYIRTFKSRIFEVVPGIGGMDYSTPMAVQDGHVIMFSLEGDQLRIQAVHESGRRYELIPHTRIRQDFPLPLIEEHAHWLSLDDGTVEFRPLDSQWRSSRGNWTLQLAANAACRVSRIKKTVTEHLSNIHQATFRLLSRRLLPIEEAAFIVAVYHEDGNRTVTATLPRLRLNFSLRQDQHMHCDTFPNMIIDIQQSCGTLVGLCNKLVLKAEYDENGSMRVSRSILVPHGIVTARKQGQHMSVTIGTSGSSSVAYSKYDVDEDLCRLSGDSDMISRLFKIYLHAVTSHCLPDQLTRRMGVEQALAELSSASVHSFMQLGDMEVGLIRSIGSLTPVREFYPKHRRSMQTVYWNDAPALVQHSAFALLTGKILEHTSMLSRLGLDSSSKVETVKEELQRDEHLTSRAAARSQIHYSAGFAGGIYTKTTHDAVEDNIYMSQSASSVSSPDLEVVATKVHMLQEKRDGVSFSLVHHVLNAHSSIQGPGPSLALGYSPAWFKIDLASLWLTMYKLSQRTTLLGVAGHHRLTFALATMSWSSPNLRNVVSVLSAIAYNQSLQMVNPPPWTSYDLTRGFEPKTSEITRLIAQHQRNTNSTPAAHIAQDPDESPAQFDCRKQLYHQTMISRKSQEIAIHLLRQTSTSLTLPSTMDVGAWFQSGPLLLSMQNYFQTCEHNSELRAHITTVERTLQGAAYQISLSVQPLRMLCLESHEPLNLLYAQRGRRIADLRSLLRNVQHMPPLAPYPAVSLTVSKYLEGAHDQQHAPPPNTLRLHALIEECRTDEMDSIRRLYGEELRQSMIALEQMGESNSATIGSGTIIHRQELVTYLQTVSLRYKALWVKLLLWLRSQCRISDDATIHEVVTLAGLGPCVSLLTVLPSLAFSQRAHFSDRCRTVVLHLCRTFVLYQQLERMRKLAVLGHDIDLGKEWSNWRQNFTDESPDDLLLQVDGDFRFRAHQVHVAREMISPRSGSSTTQQLNMGEGKSSVIVPMMVSALSTGTALTRVVVLKSLSKQMFHLLVGRLGALVNRRVFYLPFSRQTNLEGGALQVLQKLLQQCAEQGGVLLAQPEHVLSLKLMTVDTCISSIERRSLSTRAIELANLQMWLAEHARDILDESDELLSCQYQLIYTSGTQRHLDDAPDRWTTVQQTLSLLSTLLLPISRTHPREVEYLERGPGCFPALRLHQNSDGERNAWSDLKHRVAEHVLNGKLPNINLTFISAQEDRRALMDFMVNRPFSLSGLANVRRLTQGVWKGVLLLRGLLAMDVLRHVLTDKRFRVNYGLDLGRSLLAVPYAAKDIPTLRSEFSHPDVAIALTALSYYYSGLSEAQLTNCFELLSRSDDPESEYQTWVLRNPDTPVAFQRLAGVNTKDAGQFRDRVYPVFHNNQATIDFFLAKIVFPKEAKEFPNKLSTSGWDLAETRSHLTTGFSGTNDRKHLLPTSIQQQDLPEQLYTNALVLHYLLMPENSGYRCISDDSDTPKSMSTVDFLKLLRREDPHIRVLIDAGAQMLDLQNQELVSQWLQLSPPGVSAAVYFNDQDELTVLLEDGTVEAFQSSPYRHNMDKVVVYLDDAHTRGTDLKLPRQTRAAVTLGPKLTKDRLVQACMRLRQLGKGQCVKFFAPPECDVQIRAVSHYSNHIQAQDILRWVMLESCAQIRHYVPHWVQQGLEHARHDEGERQYEVDGDDAQLRDAWLTPEGRPLEEMYGQRDSSEGLLREALAHPDLAKRLARLGITVLHDPRLDEEQEREVSHEIERETQVERPRKVTAVKPTLHQHVRNFAKTGLVPPDSSALQLMLSSIPVPSAEASTWSSGLLSTSDFRIAVNDTKEANITTYARAVRWIASSRVSGKLVLVAISPYEANQLLPFIRKSDKVHLHVYTPRVVRSMRSFSDLSFHVVPALPSSWQVPEVAIQSQLNIFAGQLYFDSYEAVVELCAFLGVLSPESERLYEKRHIQRGSDGFIPPEHRQDTMALRTVLQAFEHKSFKQSIIHILKDHVVMRRHGVSFFRTHIGQILHGRQLTRDEFEVE